MRELRVSESRWFRVFSRTLAFPLRRSGTSTISCAASYQAFPYFYARAYFAKIRHQQVLCCTFGFRGRTQSLDELLQVPNFHRDVEPVENRSCRKGKALSNAECIVGTIGHDDEIGGVVACPRPHKSRHALRGPGGLTADPGEDVGVRVRRSKASRQNFKVSLFTLSDTSHKSAVNSNRPINLRGFGSHWIDRR